MVALSQKMKSVQSNESCLQLRFLPDDKIFGVPWYWHGTGIIIIHFDPWNGNLLEESYKKYIEWIDDDSKTKEKVQIEKKHNEGVCESLSYYIDGGDDEGMTSIIHIPNIRTYAILNKKEYGGFEPMDYCPFCGAKLPERLDGKLTEILQKEYGLTSWRDYKKAPKEFRTDEWWKKRGL